MEVVADDGERSFCEGGLIDEGVTRSGCETAVALTLEGGWSLAGTLGTTLLAASMLVVSGSSTVAGSILSGCEMAVPVALEGFWALAGALGPMLLAASTLAVSGATKVSLQRRGPEIWWRFATRVLEPFASSGMRAAS